jgi:hypothetical protein
MGTGSFNGDGRPELMIGARANTTSGFDTNGGVARSVNPIFGGSVQPKRGLPTDIESLEQFVRLEGSSDDEAAISSFAAQGDLNGDGYGDLIFGSWRFDHPDVPDSPTSSVVGNDTGAAFIIWGRENRTPLVGRRGFLPPQSAYVEAFRNSGTRKILDPGPELRVVLDFAAEGGFPDDDLLGILFSDELPESSVVTRGGPAAQPISGVWTIGGEAFAETSVTGRFTYLPRAIVGLDPSTLELYYSEDEGSWVPVGSSTVDTRTRTVVAPLNMTLRNRYALFARPATTSADGLVIR